MPTKKISTKCNVFLQLIIFHPHFTHHVCKKNPQNHPHFIRLKIRRSANPHFTGGQYRLYLEFVVIEYVLKTLCMYLKLSKYVLKTFKYVLKCF